jgi:dihydrolipoamide dehydrogenase
MAEREVEVAIIGAGTAGLAAYREVREHTDRVVLIEGGAHGTTCARVGCMPSKLLIAAAEAAHAVREAPVFGIEVGSPQMDGRAVMARLRALRDDFVGSVLEMVEEMPAMHRLDGHARFIDDHRLQVGDHTVVTAGRILIATGSRPVYPSLLEAAGDLLATSDDVFEWPDLPGSVAVFGGGIVGLELGQALHRLGVRMRLFGKGGAVGPLSDPKVRDYAAETFAAEFPFLPDAQVRSVRRRGKEVEIVFADADGGERTERFERLLAATGGGPTSTGSASRTPASRSTTRACPCSTGSPARLATARCSSPVTPMTTCRCCTKRRTTAGSPATTPGGTPTCVLGRGVRRSASCSASPRSRPSAGPGGRCRPGRPITRSARCRSRIRDAAG